MVINFHFLLYFLLAHDDMISSTCFVTFYENFE